MRYLMPYSFFACLIRWIGTLFGTLLSLLADNSLNQRSILNVISFLVLLTCWMSALFVTLFPIWRFIVWNVRLILHVISYSEIYRAECVLYSVRYFLFGALSCGMCALFSTLFPGRSFIVWNARLILHVISYSEIYRAECVLYSVRYFLVEDLSCRMWGLFCTLFPTRSFIVSNATFILHVISYSELYRVEWILYSARYFLLGAISWRMNALFGTLLSAHQFIVSDATSIRHVISPSPIYRTKFERYSVCYIFFTHTAYRIRPYYLGDAEERRLPTSFVHCGKIPLPCYPHQ